MIKKFLAVAAIVMTAAGGLYATAAPQPTAKIPVEIVADIIDYDSAQGVIEATGTVRITQGQAVITGTKAKYNTKSQEGRITGGVKAVNQDSTLTAEEVQTFKANTHLIAVGDPVLVQGQSRLTGSKIEYFSDSQYALIPSKGKVEMPDGIMTADKIEAFLAESTATGTGSVHMVSPNRKLDATANQATYYGEPKGQSKVILSGNARAVQDGNVLTGEALTIRLDDKAMDAKGRSKLVIVPQ